MSSDDLEFYRHEESLLHSEIVFLKRQQWSVTNYALLLFGALVGLTQLEKPAVLPWFLESFPVIIPMFVSAAAFWILCDLERSIQRQRNRTCRARNKLLRALERRAGTLKPRRKAREDRRRTVVLFLGVAVFVGVAITIVVLGGRLSHGLVGAFVACIIGCGAGLGRDRRA